MQLRSILLAVCTILPIAARAAPAEVYTATLSGSSESPPTASPGIGFVAVFYFGPALIEVQASFFGLTTTVTATFIHCCSTTVGTNAGVAMPMAKFSARCDCRHIRPDVRYDELVELQRFVLQHVRHC